MVGGECGAEGVEGLDSTVGGEGWEEGVGVVLSRRLDVVVCVCVL